MLSKIIKRIIALLVISFCVLFSSEVSAIDTGRRCCTIGVEHTNDGGAELEVTGVTSLPGSRHLFVVDNKGYVAFVDVADDYCGNWDRYRPVPAHDERPWGERNFQGTTTVGGDETSALILELPPEDLPLLHLLDFSTMEISWSLELTDGPADQLGGGITWVPDGTDDGRIFLSTSSGDIALYHVTISTPTATYVETFRLPGIDEEASELTALFYHVRIAGPPELWAYFFNIDRFYVFEMGRDGEVDGSHIETGLVLRDRGDPTLPAGIAVVDHPTASEKIRVFVGDDQDIMFELHWRRGGSRFIECAWRDAIVVACCMPETNECVETSLDGCRACEGIVADKNGYDNPAQLCFSDTCEPAAGGNCGCSIPSSSHAPTPLWILGVLGIVGLIRQWRKR